QGFLHGDIAEFLLYGRALEEPERATVQKYLATKYAALLALPPSAGSDGSHQLVTVTNPAPVQMLVPGFTVRELPVSLNNVNNVKYRADGKLVALGYDGRIYLLSSRNQRSDGSTIQRFNDSTIPNGMEDKVEPFWDRES